MKVVIGVKFRASNSSIYSSREYYYKSEYAIPVGEFVIVDTSTVGLQVALVTSNVDDPDIAAKATKHIVQVIDLSQYNRILEHERKVKELKSLMDDRVRELQESALYEMLAEKDKTLADLLRDYQELLKDSE